jgi:hypothetical protein
MLRRWLTDMTERAWRARELRERELRERLRQIAASIGLAEDYIRRQAMPKTAMPKITRVLMSAGETITISGTEPQIEAAARRMVRRTKSCVAVAVVTGYYHVADCDERPTRGGFDPAGN